MTITIIIVLNRSSHGQVAELAPAACPPWAGALAHGLARRCACPRRLISRRPSGSSRRASRRALCARGSHGGATSAAECRPRPTTTGRRRGCCCCTWATMGALCEAGVLGPVMKDGVVATFFTIIVIIRYHNIIVSYHHHHGIIL
eukprot:9488336-Pyramimonas_sp.AAC.1